MAREIQGLIAGLISGIAVVGAAYGLSEIATHAMPKPQNKTPAAPVLLEAAQAPASSQLVVAGRGLYLASCADCHGKDGSGRIGPTLHQLGDPESKVAANIKKGFPGKMPGFQDQYSAAQINSLVAYIQSLH